MTCEPPLALGNVLDLLLDVVCVVDAQGRFVFISAACERLLGYTQDELTGTRMIDLVLPDDRERTLQAAEEIMQDRPLRHFENRYVRKDGRIVHVMWSARWSATDRLRVAVARDITERKRAERMREAVYRISEAAHASESLLPLYEQIHAIIDDLLPADRFSVVLYDAATDTLSFPYCADRGEPAPPERPLDHDSPIARVIRGREPLLTSDPHGTSVGARANEAGAASADWLGVPLCSQTGVIGALVIESESDEVHYTEQDQDLLGFVATQVAVTLERKQAEYRLRHLASHDVLTDMPNRSLFYDRFEVALKRARRDDEGLALLYVDLDGFKQVNDRHGHEVGDQLLRAVAHRLSGVVRESDTVARMGGDEFTVLLSNLGAAEGVAVVIDKFRAAMAAPFELAGVTVTIAASIGAAVYPEDGDNREALLRQADARMYSVK